MTTDAPSAPHDRNERIREIVAGSRHDPETGGRIAVVSDGATHRVLGHRVEEALASSADIMSVVLPRLKADEATIADVAERTRDADGVIAVGSGRIDDVCKFVTFSDGRPYAVFATAPSMNGFTRRPLPSRHTPASRRRSRRTRRSAFSSISR